MKKLFILLVTGVMATFTHFSATAQEFKEHISKEFTPTAGAAATTLAIYNIDGSIKVEGYSGDKVILEIEKVITADDNQTLEVGKKEFKLEFNQTNDTIMAYIAEPYDSRPHRHYNDWNGDRKEIEYRYSLEFTVKVPFAMSLDISTVNEGKINVQDVTGTLHVNNVNDGITIKNAKGTTSAHTVNGSVIVTYVAVPSASSSYSTINGDIKVTYPGGFSADMEFKSMNGEYYTDFPDAQILPAEVVKNVSHHGDGTTYKLNSKTVVRVGNGGNKFKFETLNGNIYIKKQS
jgi:DUF4097 and DUF4098 domain-containing protein YvlB